MPKTSREPFPSADEIAARAHELFATGGRRIALIPEYWRTAERELLADAADRVLSDERRRTAGFMTRGVRGKRQTLG
jgi:hypothetical protein